jgi:hypothetical protein
METGDMIEQVRLAVDVVRALREIAVSLARKKRQRRIR